MIFMQNQQLVLFKDELYSQGFYGILTTLIDYYEKRSCDYAKVKGCQKWRTADHHKQR